MRPAGAKALSVEDVSKHYGGPGGQRALSDVRFAIDHGEIVGLLGANGAGKTTLLKIITTLLYASSGRVLVNGIDVRERPKEVRRAIGFVSCDERSFYWRLTGRQNLAFFGALYGIDRADVESRGAALLATLGLAHAADEPYQGYSAGMKQKLSIARGLLADPSIVFYDEPTRSLDPLSAQHVRDWIRAKRVESPHQTHVIATHQLSEAEALCDRVLILTRGRLIAEGTIREIRDAYQARDHEVHCIRYAGAPLADELKPDPANGLYEVADAADGRARALRIHAAPGGAVLSRVLEHLLRSGRVVQRCETEEVSFDEVFCSLVAAEHEAGRDRLHRVEP